MATLITFAGTRQRIVNYFVTAGATDAAHAIPFTPGERRAEHRLFARLLAFGAVREGKSGRYWLDERRVADFRKEGLAKMLGALALAGLAAAGAVALNG